MAKKQATQQGPDVPQDQSPPEQPPVDDSPADRDAPKPVSYVFRKDFNFAGQVIPKDTPLGTITPAHPLFTPNFVIDAIRNNFAGEDHFESPPVRERGPLDHRRRK